MVGKKWIFFIPIFFFLLASNTLGELKRMTGMYAADYEIKKFNFNADKMTRLLKIEDNVITEIDFHDFGPGCGPNSFAITKYMIIRNIKPNIWMTFVKEKRLKKLKFIRIVDMNNIQFDDIALVDGKNISKHNFIWKRIPLDKVNQFENRMKNR